MLAEEYGITGEMFHHLFIADKTGRKIDYSGWIDMCHINDDYDTYLNETFSKPAPIELNTEMQSILRAYPVSLGIHKYATKRDVLDYVEKRWNLIQSYVEIYRDKEKRFRKRNDLEITDYIWENRGIPAKELAEKVNEKFTNVNFIYSDISKIISLEKMRRKEK